VLLLLGALLLVNTHLPVSPQQLLPLLLLLLLLLISLLLLQW
jgi:hypothetical protein